jgi:hypothetical protein
MVHIADRLQRQFATRGLKHRICADGRHMLLQDRGRGRIIDHFSHEVVGHGITLSLVLPIIPLVPDLVASMRTECSATHWSMAQNGVTLDRPRFHPAAAGELHEGGRRPAGGDDLDRPRSEMQLDPTSA